MAADPQLLDDAPEDAEVVEVSLPYDYEPRHYQVPVWQAMFPSLRPANEPEYPEAKRAVLVWHRRAGKDKTVVNILAAKAMERVGNYVYLLPKQTQARKAIWQGIGKDGKRFIDHVPAEIVANRRDSDMLIELVNGSTIQVGGSDNYDSWMGTNPVGIILSEYSLQDPNAWEYLRPILLENDGWAVFIYTPRGRNHGWFMWERAKRLAKRPETGWFAQLLTVEDTGAVSIDAVRQEIAEEGMSEELAEQEWWCSFDAFNAGAYYGKQMARAWKEERITVVPVDPVLPVHTAWDLGLDDSTAIWMIQVAGKGDIRVVGYYENADEGLPHYCKWLRDWAQEHDVSFGRHVLPHDAHNRDYLTTAKTTREEVVKANLQGHVMVAPRLAIEDGIEMVRALLPMCRFDEHAAQRGILCLTDYQREWDEVRKVWKSTPKHDWTSHGADAFRTFAQVFKPQLFVPKVTRFPTGTVVARQDWNPFD